MRGGRRGLFALSLLLLLGHAATAQGRRALVVGVSDYPKYQPEERLKFAHIDAQRFATLIEGEPAGRAKVTLLLNADASRESVFDTIDTIKTEPTPGDLFVFFSGHAELDPRSQQLYLMPYDGDKNHLAASGIPATEFLTNLKAIGAKNVIMFIDACHSGAALLGKGASGDAAEAGSLDGVLARLNQGGDGVFMAFVSATANERSWEDDEFGQGIFARFVIKGLLGEADGIEGARDGRVTAGELKRYLEQEVSKRARSLGKPVETPVVSPEFRSDFVLTLVASAAGGPATGAIGSPLPLQRIAQVREADPELGLMLHLAASQTPSPTDEMAWSETQLRLRESFNQARWRKVGTLERSLTTETMFGAAIDIDASLLAACVEPSDLLIVDLSRGRAAKRIALALAASGSRRRATLDSCAISISADRQFAAVSLRSVSFRQGCVTPGWRRC